MAYIQDAYVKEVTGAGTAQALHVIDTSKYTGASFTVTWKVRAQAVVSGNTFGVAGNLQGFFQRVGAGDLVPIPADASPIMVYLVGTAPVFDTDIGTAPTLTGSISGTTLTLTGQAADATTSKWYSEAVIEGTML